MHVEFAVAQLHRDELAALMPAMIAYMVGLALDDVVLDENDLDRANAIMRTMEPEHK